MWCQKYGTYIFYLFYFIVFLWLFIILLNMCYCSYHLTLITFRLLLRINCSFSFYSLAEKREIIFLYEKKLVRQDTARIFSCILNTVNESTVIYMTVCRTITVIYELKRNCRNSNSTIFASVINLHLNGRVNTL